MGGQQRNLMLPTTWATSGGVLAVLLCCVLCSVLCNACWTLIHRASFDKLGHTLGRCRSTEAVFSRGRQR